MEIATQAEVVLRQAEYNTWRSTGVSPPVTCFENATLLGFIHVFASLDELMAHWESRQQVTLARHAVALRTAGVKAWNVYSIFLTAEEPSSRLRALQQIEENFSLTRKIARVAIRTAEDVERALLPLTAVKVQPLLADADFKSRLRSRLKGVPLDALSAFLDETNADEVARILGGQS
jgi:hypothetical protein